MKYSEFEREVEKLGFTCSNHCEQVVVRVDGQTVMGVSTGRKYIVDNEWNKYQQLNETTQEQLFDLAYQLAKTPRAEREEEKLYRVKFPNIKRSGLPIILTKVNWDGSGYTTMDWPCESYIEKHQEQFTFTEQEIKAIDERYFLFAEEVKK